MIERDPPIEPSRLELDIQSQPDDFTCGSTCLHAVYRYYRDTLGLSDVIQTVEHLDEGGTLGVHLARHALQRGYRARIYTYNLTVFDPTWFEGDADVAAKLAQQVEARADDQKLVAASRAYTDFIQRGGDLRLVDMTASLISGYLRRGVPIITGLNATYLYRCAREKDDQYDDISGSSTGHFVVLCGYDAATRRALVADPYPTNPFSGNHYYSVDGSRLVCSILLGIVTHDANLVILQPPKRDSAG